MPMPAPTPSSKGQHTRAVILDAALSLATQVGLEGLSIGALAESTGMILHIGQLALVQSCRRMAAWQERFGSAAPQSISVNV